jgi:hypothetical protein
MELENWNEMEMDQQTHKCRGANSIVKVPNIKY